MGVVKTILTKSKIVVTFLPTEISLEREEGIMQRLRNRGKARLREAMRQLINKEHIAFWITPEYNGKWKTVIDLGTFDSKEEAYLAYEEAQRKLFSSAS